ncbi:MAG: hypothetical protein WAW15_01115 [Minisyncoccales bacterium]
MNQETKNNCCENKKEGNGLKEGIIYAIAPHTFCILFIVFSLFGSIIGMSFIKGFLMNKNAFLIIFIASIFFAVLSAFLYLKRCNLLSFDGMKRKWKYLSILFGTIIAVNFLFFFYVFPAVANINAPRVSVEEAKELNYLELNVSLPCSGHAPLVIDELKKINGIKSVEYVNPNTFKIYYDFSLVSEQTILLNEIFKEFKAKIIWSQRN